MAAITKNNEHGEKQSGSTSGPPSRDYEHGVVAHKGPISPAQTTDKTLAILELVKAQDAHHPMRWPAWKRWGIISIYCLLQLFVTMTSTSYVATEYDLEQKYNANIQVVVLGQSLFIVGNAVGPAFMGPFS